MTADELREAPPTIHLLDAAKALGVGRSAAYRMAKEEGHLVPGVPVLRVGNVYRVPTAFVLQALGLVAA